jgi:geranylgeranyl pyrophosphate synthase
MSKLESIESALRFHLNKELPHHLIKDVYNYALFPGGKFFRPLLVHSIFEDINPNLYLKETNQQNSNLHLLASALEMHHTYTLLHDDLPCMDDDKERRGKPCTHIQFGEWKALLTGDGLLNISYSLLSQIKHPHALAIMRLNTWALGPKGLIHGQVLDLSLEMSKSFKNTLRTHELKTGRLILSALLSSALCAQPTLDKKLLNKIYKQAHLLGSNFQFIDDLSELTEPNLSTHEKEVNPWILFPEECLNHTILYLNKFQKISFENNFKNLDLMVEDYYKKMLSQIEKNLKNISHHSKIHEDKLLPVIFLLKNFSKR